MPDSVRALAHLLSVKASLPTLKVVKEAFTDSGSLKGAFTDSRITPEPSFAPVTSHVTTGAREGPLHAAQPRKLALHGRPKYLKGSFTEPSASKGAFMYRKRASAGTDWGKGVVSGKCRSNDTRHSRPTGPTRQGQVCGVFEAWRVPPGNRFAPQLRSM
ncbi:hypothetical protein GCM10027598_47290 [Amycolatopsis oliviviridis]|uniref:Uncharacterized protein n=1 Tax=Amycolatopsis oliviviridis TaxID=1471590 RepID=A0ABQ3MAE6_9PSEU|nr:hypothetical protein GCM10017790_82130 [Amycolatopsis oliviviridis]